MRSNIINAHMLIKYCVMKFVVGVCMALPQQTAMFFSFHIQPVYSKQYKKIWNKWIRKSGLGRE